MMKVVTVLKVRCRKILMLINKRNKNLSCYYYLAFITIKRFLDVHVLLAAAQKIPTAYTRDFTVSCY